MAKPWTSLGEEDIIPLFQPTQEWATEKLLKYGVLWTQAWGDRKPEKRVELRSAAQAAGGCALYYGLTGEDRHRQAAERGWEFFRKYNDTARPPTNIPNHPDLYFPCPEIGPDWQVEVQLGGIETGRCYTSLLHVWEILERPEILEYARKDFHWYIDVAGYDEKNHAFSVHVDASGREMEQHANSYVYNMMAAFASAMWRVGFHSSDQELMEVDEDMITQRLLPRQCPDGYWNYGEPREGFEPVPPVVPREQRLENYHGLTLLKLSYLLAYDSWAEREDFRETLLRAADYATSFVDQHGMASPWPTLEGVRLGFSHAHKSYYESQGHLSLALARIGLRFDRPDLVETASRMMNWWSWNRPVLLPFMDEGNAYYGYRDLWVSGAYIHAARQVLVLAREGWHLRRVDPCIVELVHMPQDSCPQ